jgi:hypothetical protein
MIYEKYCGPERIVRALASSETPPLGAHLVTPWLGYTHHGIHVGDSKVVQYGALMYEFIRKPVEEVSLAEFAQGRPVFVVAHAGTCFDTEEVIRRARSRLGEKRYRLLTNNCEHYVEWCLHDVHRSFEVEIALNFPRWFGERFLAALLRFARNEDTPLLPAKEARATSGARQGSTRLRR